MNEAGVGIAVRNLRKTYRRVGSSRVILEDVTLALPSGQTLGIVGTNGAGKSTLMGCLVGLRQPDSGMVNIDGRPPHSQVNRERIGYVPERANFHPTLTGAEFLRYLGGLSNIPRRQLEERISSSLEWMKLQKAGGQKLSRYSRGMLQRINICQAVLSKPRYLFLDDPTLALDPHGIILLRELLLREKARGTTVVVSSHNLPELERICDRLALLTNGHLLDLPNAGLAQLVLIRLLPNSMSDRLVAGLSVVRAHGDELVLNVSSAEEVPEILRELLRRGGKVIEVRPEASELEALLAQRTADV